MADRRSLDVISVAGPQAESYLQGQLSQNVQSLQVGQTKYSLLLQPQGHLVGWFRVVRTGDESFALIADQGPGADILARLERFKLGTKADMILTTESVISLRSSEPLETEAVRQGLLWAVPLAWPSLEGVDLFGSAQSEHGDPEDSGLVEALRIAAGIPGPQEWDDKTIPAELGVVDMSADFTKGCYTGQELVARIDSRGNNTPRQVRVLCGLGPVPMVGDAVGDDQGTVTSVVAVSDGWLALASLKRSALDAGEVDVAGGPATISVPVDAALGD